NKTQYQLNGRNEDIACVEYSGTYEVSIPIELIERGCEVALNLALPIEHKGQSGVKITSCYPDNLLQYADYSKGMILGFPLCGSGLVSGKLGYVFRCEVREVKVQAQDSPEDPAGLSRYLQSGLNAEYLTKAKSLLGRIDLEPDGDPYINARSI